MVDLGIVVDLFFQKIAMPIHQNIHEITKALSRIASRFLQRWFLRVKNSLHEMSR
jgi:hypothetical protein